MHTRPVEKIKHVAEGSYTWFETKAGHTIADISFFILHALSELAQTCRQRRMWGIFFLSTVIYTMSLPLFYIPPTQHWSGGVFFFFTNALRKHKSGFSLHIKHTEFVQQRVNNFADNFADLNAHTKNFISSFLVYTLHLIPSPWTRMAAQRIIVTEDPAWYQEPVDYKNPSWYQGNTKYEDPFFCKSTKELYGNIAGLMLDNQGKLSELERSYRIETQNKIIRDMTIRDLCKLKQEPSVSLLIALMDLIDIEGGNDLRCMSNVDRAGLKHVILAHRNYTLYYIPKKELARSATHSRKVIPVVSHYKDDTVYHDRCRSRIGTYMVYTPKEDEHSVFMQEVLFVPGPRSLKVLKQVTGDKFEFWNMSLEMPIHPTALTPSFEQITPTQILRYVKDKAAPDDGDNQAVCTHLKEVRPMCVLGDPAGSSLGKRKQSESSLDYLTEDQVKCDLSSFVCESGEPKIVYFQKYSKHVHGKRVHTTATWAPTSDQTRAAILYASTTVRFCRAVKCLCIKGNGDSVSCWNDTLNDLNRTTFLVGSDMCQETYNLALTAFSKRVNSTDRWCNYLPRHVESLIMDAVSAEAVSLGIRLLACKIPNSFAVAEILYSSQDKLDWYQQRLSAYVNDKKVREQLQLVHISKMDSQMQADWAAVTKLCMEYTENVCKGDLQFAARCKKVFDDPVNAQKEWFTLIKRHIPKAENKGKVDNKDLNPNVKVTRDMLSKIKVLFSNVRTYQIKMKKLGAPARSNNSNVNVKKDGGADDDADNDEPSKLAAPATTTKSPLRTPREEFPNCASADSPKTGTGNMDIKQQRSILIPDSAPATTWIKNMSSLLLSGPWLHVKDPTRRNTVCTLLGLDKTLLNERFAHVLRDWVNQNRSVVETLKDRDLKDRLSVALVDCLDFTSTETWKNNVALACAVHLPVESTVRFSQTKQIQGSYGKPPVKSKKFKCHPRSSRDEGENDNSLVLRQAQESDSESEIDQDPNDVDCYIMGDDLTLTADYDENETVDEYDSSDGFIDNRSEPKIYDTSSEEEIEENAFCMQARNRRKSQHRSSKVKTIRAAKDRCFAPKGCWAGYDADEVKENLKRKSRKIQKTYQFQDGNNVSHLGKRLNSTKRQRERNKNLWFETVTRQPKGCKRQLSSSSEDDEYAERQPRERKNMIAPGHKGRKVQIYISSEEEEKLQPARWSKHSASARGQKRPRLRICSSSSEQEVESEHYPGRWSQHSVSARGQKRPKVRSCSSSSDQDVESEHYPGRLHSESARVRRDLAPDIRTLKGKQTSHLWAKDRMSSMERYYIGARSKRGSVEKNNNRGVKKVRFEDEIPKATVQKPKGSGKDKSLLLTRETKERDKDIGREVNISTSAQDINTKQQPATSCSSSSSSSSSSQSSNSQSSGSDSGSDSSGRDEKCEVQPVKKPEKVKSEKCSVPDNGKSTGQRDSSSVNNGKKTRPAGQNDQVSPLSQKHLSPGKSPVKGCSSLGGKQRWTQGIQLSPSPIKGLSPGKVLSSSSSSWALEQRNKPPVSLQHPSPRDKGFSDEKKRCPGDSDLKERSPTGQFFAGGAGAEPEEQSDSEYNFSM